MVEKIAHRGKQILKHIKRHRNIYWLAMITGLLWGCLKNNEKNKNESQITYIVQAKDNIINILKDHNIIPSEEHIDHFKELNNLEDDIIHIWQTIKIDLTDTIIDKHINQEIWFDYKTRYDNIETKNQNLENYYFVIDPWHGGVDPWSHGWNDWEEFWEAHATWDLALRLIKWLKENWAASITPTRINTFQWMDDWTLPGNGMRWAIERDNIKWNEIREFDKDGLKPKDNLNENDFNWENECSQKQRLSKRNKISNIIYEKAHKQWKKLIYISLHLDVNESMGILYQPEDQESKKLAEDLINNWFVRKYNNKVIKEPHVKEKSLQVLRESKKDKWVLIEFCDITKDENRKMRDAKNRQEVIESLIESIVKSLKKR